MLLGEYEHTIDDKNRLTLPAKFRRDFEDGCVVTRGLDGCLFAWTPEGFYGATPGAFGVLQWQVNRGFDAAADTVPVSAIPRLRRRDALALVLQELETARALGIADLKAARRDVQIATGSKKAPGARLHVLTIGVSDDQWDSGIHRRHE